MIDRMQLIKEELLREYIRKQLSRQDRLTESNETKLRQFIRGMLDEGVDVEPTENTGINVLEGLLNTIVPSFKQKYKMLTTDPSQRISFIKHLLSFVEDSLKPDQINDEAAIAAEKEEKIEEEIKINVDQEEDNLDDQALFPDIDNKETDADKGDDELFVSLEGEDKTGRDMAIESFKQMNKQITKAYSGLEGKDASLFKKYLIKNLDLHRMQAEKELPEPDDTLANIPVEKL